MSATDNVIYAIADSYHGIRESFFCHGWVWLGMGGYRISKKVYMPCDMNEYIMVLFQSYKKRRIWLIYLWPVLFLSLACKKMLAWQSTLNCLLNICLILMILWKDNRSVLLPSIETSVVCPRARIPVYVQCVAIGNKSPFIGVNDPVDQQGRDWAHIWEKISGQASTSLWSHWSYLVRLVPPCGGWNPQAPS